MYKGTYISEGLVSISTVVLAQILAQTALWYSKFLSQGCTLATMSNPWKHVNLHLPYKVTPNTCWLYFLARKWFPIKHLHLSGLFGLFSSSQVCCDQVFSLSFVNVFPHHRCWPMKCVPLSQIWFCSCCLALV